MLYSIYLRILNSVLTCQSSLCFSYNMSSELQLVFIFFYYYLTTLYASKLGVNARSMQSFTCMLDTTNKRVKRGEFWSSKSSTCKVTQ